MKTFLRLTATEWAGIGVLIMAAAFLLQWREAHQAPTVIETHLEQQERKLDALFTWADLVSQLQGWPRPRIPERPIALPDPPAKPPVDGEAAAVPPFCPELGCGDTPGGILAVTSP